MIRFERRNEYGADCKIVLTGLYITQAQKPVSFRSKNRSGYTDQHSNLHLPGATRSPSDRLFSESNPAPHSLVPSFLDIQ